MPVDNLSAERPIRLAEAERELLLGIASGMRTEALAAEVGLTTRGTEDRLRRTRGKLKSRTTVEAAAKAVALGLIL